MDGGLFDNDYIIGFKATVLFVVLFITLDVGLFTLAANMTGNTTCTKVGGIFVVISAICAWYGMFAGIADRYNSYFTINPVQFRILGVTKTEMR